MKKLFVVLFVLLSLCSCTSHTDSCSAVMEKLYMPNGIICKNDSDICDAEYISPEELSYLYYGEQTPLKELDRIEEYCVYLSKFKSISELHIIKARYQSDVEPVKRMLQSRADFLTEVRINPNPSDFFCDTRVEYEIFSKGRLVFLVVGNTEATRDNLERLF